MELYNLDSVFTFGKFKGKTLRETLFIPDQLNWQYKGNNYIEWCLLYHDTFCISEETLEEICKIKRDFTIRLTALESLKEKYQVWENDQEKLFNENNDNDTQPNDPKMEDKLKRSKKVLKIIEITKNITHDNLGNPLGKNSYKNILFEDLNSDRFDYRVIFKDNRGDYDYIKEGYLMNGEIEVICDLKIVKFENETLHDAILNQKYKYLPAGIEDYMFNKWQIQYISEKEANFSKPGYLRELDGEIGKVIQLWDNPSDVDNLNKRIREILSKIGIDLSYGFVDASISRLRGRDPKSNTNYNILTNNGQIESPTLVDSGHLILLGNILLNEDSPFESERTDEFGKVRDRGMVTRLRNLAKSDIKFRDASFIENLKNNKYPDKLKLLLEAIKLETLKEFMTRKGLDKICFIKEKEKEFAYIGKEKLYRDETCDLHEAVFVIRDIHGILWLCNRCEEAIMRKVEADEAKELPF